MQIILSIIHFKKAKPLQAKRQPNRLIQEDYRNCSILTLEDFSPNCGIISIPNENYYKTSNTDRYGLYIILA